MNAAPGVQTQEQLLPASGTSCPGGVPLQNGLCVSPWVSGGVFPDQLSANPQTGHDSVFNQMFWVATLPNAPTVYVPFNGQVKIDAYKPSPSATNSLDLAQVPS
jgi:hypothetical protein